MGYDIPLTLFIPVLRENWSGFLQFVAIKPFIPV
jgi:hypothetical protein